MKSNWIFGLLSACLVNLGTAAQAQELTYRWTKGRTYHFEVTSDDTVGMKGMGVDMKDAFKTSSSFAIQVDKVKKDGTAEGTLSIERFDVKSQDGRSLAALDKLPPSALRNKLEVDPKGRFTFKEEIYILVDDEGDTMLVSAAAGPTGSTATARAGGQEVTLWASFDPKTGALSGGATVKQVGTKKRKVKVEQDKARVDLVPRQFMELLRLPDGPVGSGSGKLAIDTTGLGADLEMSSELLSKDDSGIKLRTVMKSKTKASAPSAPAEEAEDEGGLGGLPGMPGVPGMTGIPGMTGGSAGGGTSTSFDADATATLDMDTKAGMLRSMKGTIVTRSDVSGMMTMETRSEIDLVVR